VLVFWSFGLSLLSYRSISVPPVRGGTYFGPVSNFVFEA
jgi:hypothetical protein